MKGVCLALVMTLLLGGISQAGQILGACNQQQLQCLELLFAQEATHQRQDADRAAEVQFQLKQKAKKLDNLYRLLEKTAGDLHREQLTQFQQRVQGLRNLDQDKLVSKLSKDLKSIADKLYKLNQ